MTSYLISQCYSFNPLSTKQIPITRPVIDPTRYWVLNHQPKKPVWAPNVSVPLKTIAIEGNENNREMRNGTNGVDSFDPGSPPPFGLAEIRAAIPKHCWVKDTWRSMSYVVSDVATVVALAALATYVNSLVSWPFYWFAQGTMFWALFVLGHDCGHGSFSNDAKLNSVVGHYLHSSILVPYHGWRISHRTHHQNHGHVENDESWHPFNQHGKSRRNFLNKIVLNNSQSSSGNTNSLNITSATSEDNSSSVPPETLPNLDAQTKEKPASQVPKKTPLTAREKLRAARVLSRYNDSKPSSKMGLGSKVLDALRESDGGKKRSGLPQAPTNLFDDSKRGMPKPGLTFDFPGGADLFYIVLSVVFISTVMFTTTFVVWKLGAIHFNEY